MGDFSRSKAKSKFDFLRAFCFIIYIVIINGISIWDLHVKDVLVCQIQLSVDSNGYIAVHFANFFDPLAFDLSSR